MGTLGRLMFLVAVGAAGCAQPKFAAVPGQTEIAVSGVAIQPRAGERLEVNYKALYEYLGLRKKDPVRPERGFNEYRLAEDRRRIEAFLNEAGRFDAVVDEPEVTYTEDRTAVSVTWRVHEGAAYRIGSVELIGAPADHADALRSMIPFGTGDVISLETYRPLRRTLAEHLQDHGYGHARGYSRAFVDKTAKTVAWFYYIDPGPQTKIGSLAVEGNAKVPADVILERAGLDIDKVYSTAEKRRAEIALLDTGAFASAIVLSDADIQSGPPEHPDTGGVLAPDQVDPDGKIVPRKLTDSLAVRVIVVEAPGKQFRAEVGLEADPTRVDSYAGARLLLRNFIAPQHHVVLEGHVGYGVLIKDGQSADGVYGSALAQYLKPGFVHRALDARVTGRWRDVLYPDAMLREVVAGPGVRSNLAKGVFVDVDAFYRFGRQLDLAAFDPMTSSTFALPSENDSRGAVLEASIIADRRNDRVEPTAGWLLAMRSSYSPGGSLGDHRWLSVIGDARSFRSLSSKWSIGVRGSAGIVGLAGADGIPLGPRLFGGGSHGMRGYGRDRLSPTACDSMTGDCSLVGGRSLVESSVELRLLPFRKLYGAAVFVDAGAAGAGTNAFENGISVATGVGARIRTWYLPVGFAVSYR
ncbi:MAG: BamA/TamA family outer membrane protein, partial [Deltaproteobacteria bacterium]|nr:BamA/TamA family outer membrane protein [Deltaproteobacteria bacterium]